MENIKLHCTDNGKLVDAKVVEHTDGWLTVSAQPGDLRLTNILEDSYVKIEKLLIDDFDFGRIMFSESKHVDNNNNITISPGGVYTNGTWSLNFTTPVYIWLLEKLF
jgi:hypothetical protein